jgi:cytochrome c-type biogenesis protein
MSTAVTLAFGAGLLATVNPCGFALLPSFLSFYLGADEDTTAPAGTLARARQGFAVGLVLSGAFSGVFIVTGLVVTAGLRSVLDALPWIAFAVGLALIVVGAAMVAGRRVSLLTAARLQPGVGHRTGYTRVAAFGVGYALASLSCTLAVFLVVVSQALTVSGVAQTLAVFGAYAAGSASVLLALSVSAALAKGALARAVKRFTPIVNRLAGALLVVSGLYLVGYWLPALGSGTPNSTGEVAAWTERISSALADFFATNTTIFAVTLAAVLVLGAALIVQRHVGRRPPPRTERTAA